MEPVEPPPPSEPGWTFALSYLGKLLANEYHVELAMAVRRRGVVVEVHGAVVQRRPQPRRLPLLPVALELPGIREARMALPRPYTGEIEVVLEDDGASVRGRGEVGIDLPVSSTSFHLLHFDALIGLAR